MSRGWPDWLDEATSRSVPDRTCLEHLGPFERCRSFHTLRGAKREARSLLLALLDVRWLLYLRGRSRSA